MVSLSNGAARRLFLASAGETLSPKRTYLLFSNSSARPFRISGHFGFLRIGRKSDRVTHPERMMAMLMDFAHDALAMTEYGSLPSILVLADSDAGFERARRAAELAQCRVSGTARIADAWERLDLQVAMDAVFVDAEQDHGAAFDRLLDRLEIGARGGQFGSVVSTPLELVDAVAARVRHSQVVQLCDPSEIQRVSAVALACARQPARLHDVRRPQGPERLQQLSEEVGRIATILASLSEEEAAAPPAPSSDEEDDGPSIDAGKVRAIIRARRLRDQYFSAELFADPAWDMLLDLLAARLERRRVAVSSLCIAAAVPATTALRWIKTLTDHGLFVRAADPQDGRRVYIELSEPAAAGMESYLRAVQRISPLAL